MFKGVAFGPLDYVESLNSYTGINMALHGLDYKELLLSLHSDGMWDVHQIKTRWHPLYIAGKPTVAPGTDWCQFPEIYKIHPLTPIRDLQSGNRVFMKDEFHDIYWEFFMRTWTDWRLFRLEMRQVKDPAVVVMIEAMMDDTWGELGLEIPS